MGLAREGREELTFGGEGIKGYVRIIWQKRIGIPDKVGRHQQRHRG